MFFLLQFQCRLHLHLKMGVSLFAMDKRSSAQDSTALAFENTLSGILQIRAAGFGKCTFFSRTNHHCDLAFKDPRNLGKDMKRQSLKTFMQETLDN